MGQPFSFIELRGDRPARDLMSQADLETFQSHLQHNSMDLQLVSQKDPLHRLSLDQVLGLIAATCQNNASINQIC